jgi:hypothetical protein
MEMNDCLSTYLDELWLKVHSWDEQVRIAKVVDEVAHEVGCHLRRDPLNSAVIQDSKENIASKAIQERADAFVCIRLEAIPAPLELYDNVFSNRKNLFDIVDHLNKV